MGRSPYVAYLGHRRGPPCDLAHPHRREAQPPSAAAAGCIEQPSNRSGKAVVNGDDDLRDLLRPVAPAGAKTPTRGCPTAFIDPLTIKEVLKAFPPPPDLPDPESAIATCDSNGDGTVCVLPLPNGPINVIDNVSNA